MVLFIALLTEWLQIALIVSLQLVDSRSQINVSISPDGKAWIMFY